MASRRLEDLHPRMQKKAKRFIEIAKQQGIDVLIYCTYRPAEEQEVLYIQGRLQQFGITLEQLNERRKKLGLYPLSEKEANKIVTNARPGQSMHNHGLAFDCVPMQAGKPAWNDIQTYKRLAEIAKQLEMEWAGNWKTFKEMPHFQDSDTYNKIISKK